MSRIRKNITARRLRVGDVIQSQLVGVGGHTVSQLDWDANDPADPRVVIQTTQGTWRLRFDDPVRFPRRDDDGTIHDWRFDWRLLDDRKTDLFDLPWPTPDELKAGDILQPFIPIPTRDPWVREQLDALFIQRRNGDAWNDPAPDPRVSYEDLPGPLRNGVESGYAKAGLEVTAIYAASPQDTRWYISCYDPAAHLTRTFQCGRFDKLTFPRQTVGYVRLEDDNRLHGGVDEDGSLIVKTYGPYEYKRTGHRLIVAVHPSGRGKWPSNIPTITEAVRKDVLRGEPVYDLENVVRCRPPKYQTDESWEDLRFIGVSEPLDVEVFPGHSNEPHPKDGLRRRIYSGREKV